MTSNQKKDLTYCKYYDYDQYLKKISSHVTGTIEQIRKATNKGMIVGTDRFREELEALTGRRVKEKVLIDMIYDMIMIMGSDQANYCNPLLIKDEIFQNSQNQLLAAPF
jgi:hypothetical protein